MSDVVGVDLGGTKVAAALLNGGRLGDSAIEPTNRSSATALLDQLVALAARVGSGEVSAVGIGVPSVVEFETGRVVSSVNVPLADLPLRQLLGDRLGVPAFIDNDATVAALAEAHDEQLHPVARNLVMLTVGTGVGGGLVAGGRIYRGATGAAGELGHTLVGLALSERTVPAPNGFPQPGSLESLASGRALDRLAAGAAQRHPDSALGRLRAEAKRSSVPRRSVPPGRANRSPHAWSRPGRSVWGLGSPTRSTSSTPTRSCSAAAACWPASCCWHRRRGWPATTRCPAWGGARPSVSPATACGPACLGRRCSPRTSSSDRDRDPRRTPLIAGNWKMHKTLAEAGAFIEALLPRVSGVDAIDIAICPAYPALGPVVGWTRGSPVSAYAQNMHHAKEGAFTGEVSAPMLIEAGVRGVILGHSERRRHFGESDRALQLKVAAALEHGLVPILCVGESGKERERGETERRLRHQVQEDLARVDADRLGEVVIAYEPVWAIGTGRVASPDQAQEAQGFIRALLADRSSEQSTQTRVLYGGSVEPENAPRLLELPDVDGLLVGAASLDPHAFAAIIAAACR